MNIGFDIDGVMTNFRQFMVKYGQKFFKRDVINNKGFSVKELFGCSDEEELKFWRKYLLKYAVMELPRSNTAGIINELRSENNKIYIITLRVFTNENSIMGKIMRYIVEKWLEKSNICYDELIFSESEDKIIDILTNDIDIMVEDNPDNIIKISEYTKVICMDEEYNKDVNGASIYRARDMNEIKEIINSISLIYNKKEYDENKKLTGIPSIDKPWQKYYTYSQLHRALPKQSIYEYLWNNNKNNLNSEALNYFGRTITFDSFFSEIEKCARSLKQIGIKENDIAVICSANIPEAVYAFYAMNRIGGITLPIHPLATKQFKISKIKEVNAEVMFFMDINYDEVRDIIEQTNIKYAITISAKDSLPLLPKIVVTKDLKKNCSLYNGSVKISSKVISWSEFVKIGKDYDNNIDHIYKENMPAVILNTGGTTGISKGAVISNDNFNAMVHQYKMKAKFNKGDKMVALMPIFHGFGLCNSIHMPMCLKASSVLVPKFDKKQFYKMMIREKPNHIMGVPTLWEGIKSDPKYKNIDLSFLNGYCVSGGDTMKDEFENDCNKFLKRHNSPSIMTKGYGLTEAVASVTFTFEDCNAIGSIGIPLVNTDIKIVNPLTNQEMGYNEPGELCVSGPTVMLGYYNNDIETNRDLRWENNKLWLHTGDIGYVDENGLFYYQDRLKRIIVVSGVNVYPSKIEQIIEEFPDVLQCVCIAKKHPHKLNVPKAYVILRDNKYMTEDLKNEILNMCNQQVPDVYSRVWEIEQIEEFPQTQIGKIDYKKLEILEEEKSINSSYIRRIKNEKR